MDLIAATSGAIVVAMVLKAAALGARAIAMDLKVVT
jgi:hypothetical protein